MKGTETPHFEANNKMCWMLAMSDLLANSVC